MNTLQDRLNKEVQEIRWLLDVLNVLTQEELRIVLDRIANDLQAIGELVQKGAPTNARTI